MVYLPWVLFIAKETDSSTSGRGGRKRGSVGSHVAVNDDFPKVSRFVVK